MNDAERYALRKASITPAVEGEKPCTGCGEVRPVTDYYKHPLGRDGRAARCKRCEMGRLQQRKHGVTSEQKDRIANRQGGCAICHRESPGRKGWVVDHDHACCPGEASCPKCRRGVLCQWCNAALGYAMDNPQTLRDMADYLERHLAPAIAPPIAPPTGAPTYDTYSTNERTERTDVDGGSDRGDIELSLPREAESNPGSDCLCVDSLPACPTNCLIRWSRDPIPATWHAPPPPVTTTRTPDPERLEF